MQRISCLLFEITRASHKKCLFSLQCLSSTKDHCNKAHNLLFWSYLKCQGLMSSQNLCRRFHTSTSASKDETNKDFVPTEKQLAPRQEYFRQFESKNKVSFMNALEVYVAKDTTKRGHIEFIYSAMKCMEEFGVHRDLEAYKKLMDIFPKGKFIPKTVIGGELLHYPRHQQCAMDLLTQMENFGVVPDMEMREIILSSFGRSTHVFARFARMLYWMPKLKNQNPYLLPDPLPNDSQELARLALKKMSVDPRTCITDFKTEDLEDSFDKTWIVSAQSPVQQELIGKHSEVEALYVEGAYLVWLRRLSISYYVLRALPKIFPVFDIDKDDVSNISLHMFGQPKPKGLIKAPTLHEQEDGTVMAMCATGTSSKDSLLSWIRFLQETNPQLNKIPILFTLKSPPTDVATVNMDASKIEFLNAESQEENVINPESVTSDQPNR